MMMIIEASLSCVVAWCGTAWLSKRVGPMHVCMHYTCASLVQNAV